LHDVVLSFFESSFNAFKNCGTLELSGTWVERNFTWQVEFSVKEQEGRGELSGLLACCPVSKQGIRYEEVPVVMLSIHIEG
jgi:hypothetical protein